MLTVTAEGKKQKKQQTHLLWRKGVLLAIAQFTMVPKYKKNQRQEAVRNELILLFFFTAGKLEVQ